VVVLRLADTTQYADYPMTTKLAHKALKELRVQMATGGTEVMDLTPADVFNWKAYVSRREEAAQIIGAGVTLFELRFLNTKEPNGPALLQTLGPVWASRRCDFVVHRVDGTCTRLHPESGRESKRRDGYFFVIGSIKFVRRRRTTSGRSGRSNRW